MDKVVLDLGDGVAGFMFRTVVGRQSMAGLHGECSNKKKHVYLKLTNSLGPRISSAVLKLTAMETSSETMETTNQVVST